MVRLRVQELAKHCGYPTIAAFQRGAYLPMTTVRRVWFSTSDGSPHGPPLKVISFEVLELLAAVLDVEVGALFEQVTPHAVPPA